MKMAVLFGIFAPILFSLVLTLIPKERKELFFPLAIFGSTIPVATALYLYINQQPEPPIDAVRNREQFETIAWIKPYGIDWVLSVNGVSIMMILLTAILVPLAILSVESYHGNSDNVKNQQGQFTFSRDLAKTSPNIACPNCFFKISLGTFPGLKPFRLTVLLSSFNLSPIFSSIVFLSTKTLRLVFSPFLESTVTFIIFGGQEETRTLKPFGTSS